MQWVACTLRGAVKQLPWLLKHMPHQNLGSSGRTLLSFCQDAGATPRMLGFVDVHEAVSLQKGLRHHLEFVVPGSRVPSPRTRQAAFLSLRAALACLPTSGLGGGEGLLPVHLRLGRESCSDLALQLWAVRAVTRKFLGPSQLLMSQHCHKKQGTHILVCPRTWNEAAVTKRLTQLRDTR